MISVVIPTLNAAARLPATLAALVPAAVDGLVKEVVVADGGSTDDTLAVAEDAGARVVTAERGRGRQLAAGCAAARGAWLLALHADTRLPEGWALAAARHMAERPERAGWFRYRLDDPAPVARLWEAGVGLRCRVLAAPYGDQGLLLSRTLYDAAGGYPPGA
jgi:glycosyltransferase involved in cell wall biosynthesis